MSGRGATKRSIVGLALVLSTLFAEVARAETKPDPWQRAKDPILGATWVVHTFVRRSLDIPDGEPLREAARLFALERAKATLELAKVRGLESVLLRFDLGEVEYELGHHEEAIKVLGGALRESPDDPAALDAWVILAYACAKADRPREERDAYLAYLDRVVESGGRATATLNLAEAEMRLGNLRGAVAGYREAMRLAKDLPEGRGGHETYALAEWGLAVALDRAGDPIGARREAKLASDLDPGMRLVGFGANVFFVPEYERLWYIGLGFVAEAEKAQDPGTSARLYGRAEASFSEYLNRAYAKDPWKDLASAHVRTAKALRLAAEARAKKAPRPMPTPEEPFQ